MRFRVQPGYRFDPAAMAPDYDLRCSGSTDNQPVYKDRFPGNAPPDFPQFGINIGGSSTLFNRISG